MDPNALLWMLGSIAGGFIVLLGTVFTTISFLISRAAREYELTKRMTEETAKKSILNLIWGVSGGKVFFGGSIFLILYCLISMFNVGYFGVTFFTTTMTGFAVGVAIVLLLELYKYMNWCLTETIKPELKLAVSKIKKTAKKD